jgi:hypothetical protein
MELAALPARIHRGREIRQQRLIEPAPGELWGQLCGIDTGKIGFVTGLDEVQGEVPGILAPKREERGIAKPPPLLLSEAANVLKEEVPVRNVLHGAERVSGMMDGQSPGRVILGIAGIGGEWGLKHGQLEGGGLSLENGATDTVDADPSIGWGHSGEKADHTVLGFLAERGKGQGAVLAPAPGE